MITQLPCWLSIPALAQHDAETVASQETPSWGIDRVSPEPKDVDVILRGNFQIPNGKDATRMNNL